MRRSALLLIALLPFLLAPTISIDGSWDATGSVVLGETATDTFVTIDESDFGAGDTYDLNTRIAAVVPLDTYLPDTSGFSTFTTISCTQASLETCMSLSGSTITASDTQCKMPTNCQITITETGNVYNYGASLDNFEILGNEDGLSEIIIDPGTDVDPGTDGFNQRFLASDGATSAISTWTWDSGYALGTDIIHSDQTISAINGDGGDIVRLHIDNWGNSGARDYDGMYRVLCARYGDTNHGSDCTGVTSNGDIRIDRELPFQMDGTGLQIGALTGLTIELMETSSTTNIPEHIGMRDVKLTHTKPFFVNSSFHSIEPHRCFECWFTGNDFSSWGNSSMSIGASSGNTASRILVHDNDFTGPYFAGRCIIDTVDASLVQADPVILSFAQGGGDCRNFSDDGSGLEPFIYFPPDYPITGLQGKVAYVDCTPGTAPYDVLDCDETGGWTVALYERGTGASIDGTSFTQASCTTAVDCGWANQLKNFEIAAVYFSSESDQNQFSSNRCLDTRVCLIQQAGGFQHIVAYNYDYYTATGGCSRGIFMHGGQASGSVWEGNWSVCGFTTSATQNQGTGVGPGFTMFRNRYQEDPVTRTAIGQRSCGGDAWDGICNEAEDQESKPSENHVYLANSLGGYHTNAGGGVNVWGDCQHERSGACESPYQLYAPWILKNLWQGSEMEADMESLANNPTMVYPDITASSTGSLDNDNVDKIPTGWSSVIWPSSILYNDYGKPDWWCSEIPFPNIGAPDDDFSTTLPETPAKRIADGDACTTP